MNLRFALALVALCCAADAVQACSVCYGDPNSDMARGATWGIGVLLAIVLLVLAAIASFFVFIARKSANAPTSSLSSLQSTEKV
jgi:hypothetical protein